MRTLWLLPTLAALQAQAQVQAQAAACPGFIEVAETTQPPPGFAAYADGNPVAKANGAPRKFSLKTVMFSEGPPTEQSWLAPTASTTNKATWNFADAKDTGIWLSCAYSNTSLLLSAALRGSVRQCEVRVDRESVQSGPDCH